MPVETDSFFASVIKDHLELKERNSELDEAMPLDHYQSDDPFENHPLFKSEEQARLEETLDGHPAVELHSAALQWPGEDSVESTGPEGPALDESLWGRTRDFDWGD
jgi:hypothetical protein